MTEEIFAVKLDGVTKRYGKNAALENFSYGFEKGKITAVLGESGAGKSTLLNIISHLTDFEGTVEGAPQVSYLFQEAKLLPNLTVEGNLRFVLNRDRWDTIGEMLERVGLGKKKKKLPQMLSGGEKQRVAIARAFLFPHDLLLMDEPFSSLDLALKKSLIELVISLWKEREETVIFVTHDVHEAALLSHAAVVIKSGKLIKDIRIDDPLPRDFFSRPAVEEELVRVLIGES